MYCKEVMCLIISHPRMEKHKKRTCFLCQHSATNNQKTNEKGQGDVVCSLPTSPVGRPGGLAVNLVNF